MHVTNVCLHPDQRLFSQRIWSAVHAVRGNAAKTLADHACNDYVGVNDSRCRDIDLKLSFRARLGKDGEQTRGIKLLKVSIDQFCPAGFPGGCIEAQARLSQKSTICRECSTITAPERVRPCVVIFSSLVRVWVFWDQGCKESVVRLSEGIIVSFSGSISWQCAFSRGQGHQI